MCASCMVVERQETSSIDHVWSKTGLWVIDLIIGEDPQMSCGVANARVLGPQTSCRVAYARVLGSTNELWSRKCACEFAKFYNSFEF